ncbi:MAG: type II toxin-antitoxin system HicB family antitoxin [Gammaproteobacteria bacterium]
MNSRYEIVICWSDEDGCYLAEVPELPGCIADGASYQEALANALVAMNHWLEVARELGRSIPVPRGKLAYA